MNVDDLFDLVSYRIHPEAHIRVNEAVCQECTHRACTFSCPGALLRVRQGARPHRLRLRGLPGVRHLPARLRPRRARLELSEGGYGVRFRTTCPRSERRREGSGDEDPRPPRGGRRRAHPARARPAERPRARGVAGARARRRERARSGARSRAEVPGGGRDVTVVHLGPARPSPGCDRRSRAGPTDAVRVWSDELAGVTAPGKALVLAAAAQAAGFDLVLAGAAGVVTQAASSACSSRSTSACHA